MNSRIRAATLAAVALAAAPGWAHDVPNMSHSHAFEQTGYGQYRQGHSVNNEYGSITIWSARPYTGYQGAPAVRFARPEPITRPPGSPVVLKEPVQKKPSLNYGRESGRSYGD